MAGQVSLFKKIIAPPFSTVVGFSSDDLGYRAEFEHMQQLAIRRMEQSKI